MTCGHLPSGRGLSEGDGRNSDDQVAIACSGNRAILGRRLSSLPISLLLLAMLLA